MSQFEELKQIVNIPVSEEIDRKIIRYARLSKFFQFLTLAALITLIFTLFGNSRAYDYVAIVAFVLYTFYYIYRYKFAYDLHRILLKQCDPELYLRHYMSLLRFSNKSRGWEDHFYNIAVALCYAGRFEQADQVLALIKKYCRTPKGRFAYDLIACELAYQHKSLPALAAWMQDLNEACATFSPQGSYKHLYTGVLRYPKWLELEASEQTGESYLAYTEDLKACKNNINRVRLNYLLLETALTMSNEEQAKAAADYISRKGGSTWYKEAAEGLLSE